MASHLLFWPLLLLPSKGDAACEGPRTQAAMFANLTADYDPRERPGDHPVDVQVEVHMTSLPSVNQKLQQLGVAGYFRAWWTDSRLAFKSKAEGGCLDSIHLTEAERKKIWQPDLYFDNVLDQSYTADLLIVRADGTVWKSDRMNHVFECKMDFRNLPYDVQNCFVIVGSYTEDSSEVRVIPRHERAQLNFLEANIWFLTDSNARGLEQKFGGVPFTFTNVTITLTRQPDFYVRGIVLKAVLFVFVSWCSFFINRTVAPARVAIGVIPVLIMMNLMASVDAILPPVPYTTFLTAFLISCLFFTSLSIFEYAVVAYFLQQEVWYAEKSAVLMTLSHSELKMSQEDQQRQQKSVAEDGAVPTIVSKLRLNGTGSGSESTSLKGVVPSKIFRDHPVIHEIYDEFDRKHKGAFSAKEMRKTLRLFGQYRSAREVREIFQKLGVSEGEDMDLSHFEQFLADPNTYTPVSATTRSFWDLPHSLQLDIVMRFSYMLAFLIAGSVQGISFFH